ncbi:MAG: peptide-methionine (S)-S-oxide reductase MsrA [Rhizobiales bacterium]|nr:peptide-methionine (S)-S-oxide reductase MsrA [Hyphomicrobiales bacterium]
MKKSLTLLLAGLTMLSTAQVTSVYAATSKAVFAGGCFWCMEKPFEQLKGVKGVLSGYTAGAAHTANYRQVSSGKTKHIEAVEVTYDPDVISYKTLLKTFWPNVDPFDSRGQFCDKGHHYTAAIFPKNAEEKAAANASKTYYETLLKRSKFVTKVTDFKSFYPAEDYHQDYYKKNPIRYGGYRWNCGRDNRLESVWGKLAKH